MGARGHVQHLGSGFQRLGRLGRGEEVVRAGGDAGHEIARHQRRHQPGVVRLEHPDGVVIQIGAVLNRVAARLQEGVDAVAAVGVGGDLAAHAMGDLDDRSQLVFGELLRQTCRRIGQDAAGSRDLDDVSARAYLHADSAAAVFRTRADALGRHQVQDVVAIAVDVAVAPVDRDGRTGGDDARSGHVARANGVAQGEDGFVRRPQVGHRGEARIERAPRIPRADHRLGRVGLRQSVEARIRVRFESQVDVAVDQSRQDEGRAQVDDVALADEAVADLDDLVPLDHESFIAQHPAAGRIGQKPPHLNELRRLFSRNRRRRRGLARFGAGRGQNGRGHNQGKLFHSSLPLLRRAT